MREKKKVRTRSWLQRLFYRWLRVTARLVAISLYRVRVFGRENWPSDGGALVCANHQGFFDPVLVGLCCERQLSFLAKQSLFRFPLKTFIKKLNAIPVNRDGTGLDGLKETLKRLREDDFVLIFPEGTRSQDGQIGKLRPGFIAVARHGRVPIVPIVFDGSFQAWPKWQLLPTAGVVHVKIGTPITPAEIASLSDDELLERLQTEMHTMFAEVQASRSFSMNRIPLDEQKAQLA
ncbi:lysophospholipid acyltransferase family protein [Bremerella cremea]|uniref:lysophospholipid acyltransferase family protein n=1 Tax=Bremerella cremea TaxID=1031537 RepID=UPI0031ED1EAA